MKNIIKAILFLFISNLTAQELELNESSNFYEFSKIVEFKDVNIKQKISKRFGEINIENINKDENSISGKAFTNHLVGGFATVEIHYSVKIEYKENRYRLKLTNFILTDKNGSNPLEGTMLKKKWIRKINAKLPKIIQNIENINNDVDKW